MQVDGSFPGVLRIQEIAKLIQSDIYASYVARFSFLNGNRMLTASGLQLARNSILAFVPIIEIMYNPDFVEFPCWLVFLVGLGQGGGTMNGA